VLTGLLSDFTQKVAERWATLIVLPGLVFTAVGTVAAALGQQRWWDVPLLWRKLAQFTAAGAGTAGHPAAPDAGTVRTAVLLLCVLAISVAAALAAGGLADPARWVGRHVRATRRRVVAEHPGWRLGRARCLAVEPRADRRVRRTSGSRH
jgi:hypothetical protein